MHLISFDYTKIYFTLNFPKADDTIRGRETHCTSNCKWRSTTFFTDEQWALCIHVPFVGANELKIYWLLLFSFPFADDKRLMYEKCHMFRAHSTRMLLAIFGPETCSNCVCVCVCMWLLRRGHCFRWCAYCVWCSCVLFFMFDCQRGIMPKVAIFFRHRFNRTSLSIVLLTILPRRCVRQFILSPNESHDILVMSWMEFDIGISNFPHLTFVAPIPLLSLYWFAGVVYPPPVPSIFFCLVPFDYCSFLVK